MLNKVLPTQLLVFDADNYFYKLGLVKQPKESRKHRLFRYFIRYLGICLMIKYSISIFIYTHFKSNRIDHYQNWLIYINDFTYYVPRIRIHFNIIFILSIGHSFILQFLHHKSIYFNGFHHEFAWMKPFKMLTGKLKPSKIGFIHWDDVIVFVKRFLININKIKLIY